MVVVAAVMMVMIVMMVAMVVPMVLVVGEVDDDGGGDDDVFFTMQAWAFSVIWAELRGAPRIHCQSSRFQTERAELRASNAIQADFNRNARSSAHPLPFKPIPSEKP